MLARAATRCRYGLLLSCRREMVTSHIPAEYKRTIYHGPKGVAVVICKGDITKAKVDAIVNAANERMLGGGGVDGAIHSAAGPQLRKYIAKNVPEIASEVRCAAGEAITTPAFQITSVKNIIHTVGPVYASQSQSQPVLHSSYTNCLKRAAEIRAQSIAFPAISCGVYGYPVKAASEIAMNAVKTFLTGPEGDTNGECAASDPPDGTLANKTSLNQVIFVLFGDKEYDAFNAAAKKHFLNVP